MEHGARGEGVLSSAEPVVLLQHFGKGILESEGGGGNALDTDSALLRRFGRPESEHDRPLFCDLG